MKGSRKVSEPQSQLEWKSKETDDWKPSYKAMGRILKSDLARHLFDEQRGLCVYCGRSLSVDNSEDLLDKHHVEHFRPFSRYKNERLKHSNLFLCCGDNKSGQTCGPKKEDWFDEELSIEPIYPDCTNRFAFKTNGTVVPASPNDTAARKMLSVLNLNYGELARERRDVFSKVDGGELDIDDFWDAATKLASAYAHSVYWREGKTLP